MLIIDSFLDANTRAEMLGTRGFFPESMGDETNISSVDNAYHARDALYYSPFYFWQGWQESEADTLKKRIIRKIWEHNLPCPIEEILGFEYWTRAYKTGQYHGVHVDNDTFLYTDTGIFNGPLIGAVYYGADNEDGGFLEIHKPVLIDGLRSVLEKGIKEDFLSEESERERVAYSGNRLIICDFGHRMHATTPFPSGGRQALVVSAWRKDNPPIGFSRGDFRHEPADATDGKNFAPIQNRIPLYTELRFNVITPYGDEVFILTIPCNGTPASMNGLTAVVDTIVIKSYTFDGVVFRASFNVDNPMNAKMEILLNIDSAMKTIRGYVNIGEYLHLAAMGVLGATVTPQNGDT